MSHKRKWAHERARCGYSQGKRNNQEPVKKAKVLTTDINDGRFGRKFRLKSKEVSNVFDDSKSAAGRCVIIRCKKNSLEYSRFAAVAGKKLGKAHIRNKLKRRLRAVFRTNKNMLPTGYDFVAIAKSKTITAKHTDLVDDFIATINKTCQLTANN